MNIPPLTSWGIRSDRGPQRASMENTLRTMAEKLPGMLKSVGIRFYVSGEIKVKQLKEIRKRLYARMKQDGI